MIEINIFSLKSNRSCIIQFGRGHLYDDSSATSLHGEDSEIGAKEVKIRVSIPFITARMEKLHYYK